MPRRLPIHLNSDTSAQTMARNYTDTANVPTRRTNCCHDDSCFSR